MPQLALSTVNPLSSQEVWLQASLHAPLHALLHAPPGEPGWKRLHLEANRLTLQHRGRLWQHRPDKTKKKFIGPRF